MGYFCFCYNWAFDFGSVDSFLIILSKFLC
jgi:hypothetical protein